MKQGSLPSTIYHQEIKQFKQLPTPQNKRRITDVVCIVLFTLFALVMFILAFVLLNKENLYRTNFPANRKGKVCNYQKDDKGQSYPYLYFSDLKNPLKNRFCVKQCPLLGNQPKCGFEECLIGIYPTHPVSQGLGLYCMPDDPELSAKLAKNSGISDSMDIFITIQNLLTGLLISIVICFSWLFIVQCFPRFVVWLTMIASIILLLITAIVFFMNNSSMLRMGSGWASFFAILSLLLLLVFVYYLIMHRRRIYICAEILYNATLVVYQKWYITLYIFLYAFLTSIFTLLLVFQYIAYGSASTPTFQQTQLYYTLKKPAFLTFLLFVQMIWGLSFLRDSFNYLMSGYAIQWYFSQENQCCQPVRRHCCKNLGSIMGGSLLNGFLYLPSLVVSIFFDRTNCCCCNYFDLVREDVYGYIYLTGTSYCNAIRQCQYLCYRSQICRGNQSANRIFSLGGRMIAILLSILLIINVSIKTLHSGDVPTTLLFGVLIRCLFITSLGVDVHVTIAESLLIAFLAECELEEKGYIDMKTCRGTIKNVINDLEKDNRNNNKFIDQF